MLKVPDIERTVLVTDDATLAARVSALFSRPGRYFPVLDGPRMTRPDHSNEVLRRRNAMVLANPQRILIGGLPDEAIGQIRKGWKGCTVSENFDDHALALRGHVNRSKGQFHWGPDNLGAGLYQARLRHHELVVDLPCSPAMDAIEAGKHLLVVVERGDAMADVTASNLAFACGASFVYVPELQESLREDWLEEIYELGSDGNVTERFEALVQKARSHLGAIEFNRYKNVLFVTHGFPWGIAVPEVPTSHMYSYPDFGRAVIEGLHASLAPDRGSRTALLIDPQTVAGSEIPAIQRALAQHGTLAFLVQGRSALIAPVQFMLELLPHDIVVISSHAGDPSGERITYEYPDFEGKTRRLVVDRALGFGYDRSDDKVMVMQHFRFHSLDGVDWRDKAAKDALPVGSAINAWSELDGLQDRKEFIVAQEPIDRVQGAMAIQLADGNWLFNPQGFAPGSAPLFVNNSCWSWHELSQRATFAGARGYVGSLFPVLDPEAQAFGLSLFGKNIGHELPRAVWMSQNQVYGKGPRRPYVMVGLPFVAVRSNLSDSASFMEQAYLDGIEYWAKVGRESNSENTRNNGVRFSRFLFEDLQRFRRATAR